MADNHFRIIDGCSLPEDYRAVLRPGEEVKDETGIMRTLPRYFLEVPDWQSAVEADLTEHFGLYEFLISDVREHELGREFPRYVPTAIFLLAAALEVFRERVGRPIHISANGGYRTPAHAYNGEFSIHSWGCAANIYKIGDEMLDDEDSIEKYASLAKKSLAGLWTRPYGHRNGEADDHLHVDIGFVTLTPRKIEKPNRA